MVKAHLPNVLTYHYCRTFRRRLGEATSPCAGGVSFQRDFEVALRELPTLRHTRSPAQFPANSRCAAVVLLHHSITSATNEAINGVIKTLTKRAYGFSNFLNFRTEVLFHCGKLQLYPASGSLTPS